MFHQHRVSHGIIQEPSIAIVVRTAKQDLMTMNIMKIQFEDFFIQSLAARYTIERALRAD